jgi:hypothetical protein
LSNSSGGLVTLYRALSSAHLRCADAHTSRAAESISSSAPPHSTWAAANLRKKFPDFSVSGIGKKILLKAPAIAE